MPLLEDVLQSMEQAIKAKEGDLHFAFLSLQLYPFITFHVNLFGIICECDLYLWHRLFRYNTSNNVHVKIF